MADLVEEAAGLAEKVGGVAGCGVVVGGWRWSCGMSGAGGTCRSGGLRSAARCTRLRGISEARSGRRPPSRVCSGRGWSGVAVRAVAGGWVAGGSVVVVSGVVLAVAVSVCRVGQSCRSRGRRSRRRGSRNPRTRVMVRSRYRTCRVCRGRCQRAWPSGCIACRGSRRRTVWVVGPGGMVAALAVAARVMAASGVAMVAGVGARGTCR